LEDIRIKGRAPSSDGEAKILDRGGDSSQKRGKFTPKEGKSKGIFRGKEILGGDHSVEKERSFWRPGEREPVSS